MDKEHGRSDPGPPLVAPSALGAPDRPAGGDAPAAAGLNHSRGGHRRRGHDASRERLLDRWGGWLRRRGRIYAVIALGGFAGGDARYALGLAWPDKPGAFPWTTFGINVSGAFVLALLLVLILEAWEAPTWLRPLAGTGFLGAFTTFSAVAFALDRFAAADAVAAVQRLHGVLGPGGSRGGQLRGRAGPVVGGRPDQALHPEPTGASRVTTATRRGRRLTIYVGESDRAKGTHHPLAAEIIHRAATAGMAGASAFRGWEGFGSSEHIHTARLLSLSEDLPLVVVIVDTPERVAAFLPQLDDLIAEGTAVVDDVDLIQFGPASARGQRHGRRGRGRGGGRYGAWYGARWGRALMLWLLVGGAAAVGAMLRYGTDQVVAARILAPRGMVFPLGTFVVNIVGSVLLGAVAGLVVNAGVDLRWRTVLGVGLAGGLTTFSTWTYETVRLLEDGSLREAAANIGVSLAVGLAAASLGYAADHPRLTPLRPRRAAPGLRMRHRLGQGQPE